jgi:hypothetical protein
VDAAMSDAPNPVQRVERMLVDVLVLTRRVIAEKQSWQANAEELLLLGNVSTLTNQPLPAEVGKSSSVALGFLLMAKFALESLLRTLKSDSDSRSEV